jgi:chorismate dehydratase
MSLDSIRVSVVKYLNSIPFVYGLEKSAGKIDFDLHFDTPSDCARKVRQGEVDLGLIPVSEFGSVQNGEIIGDYCIGADGPVYSVCLVGDKPINELERIYMDPHSRTSVNLAKILAREFWMKEFVWLETEDGFEKNLIKGRDGGVVIGDKVFGIAGRYPYQYDLAEQWKEMTGLPFVFAAWVANKPLDEDWVKEFNDALKIGVNSIPDVLAEFPYQNKLENVDLYDYLTNKISYTFDKQKRAGMALFLDKII